MKRKLAVEPFGVAVLGQHFLPRSLGSCKSSEFELFILEMVIAAEPMRLPGCFRKKGVDQTAAMVRSAMFALPAPQLR
jgi:hypothetical protein